MVSRSVRYPLRKARLNRARKASDGPGKGWQRKFDDPIALPSGRSLLTLEDAARYIQKLPEKEQDLPHWQTATLTLINTAAGRVFLFHANAAMLQALNHGEAGSRGHATRKQAKSYKIVR